MIHPVILIVDDEPAVLVAIRHDLHQRYGRDYHILGAETGVDALATLHALVLRGAAVALVVADQRMPGMIGIALLAAARDLVPAARRVLLTAYADTEAAIQAINTAVHLDYYIQKPWHPPEQRLFPVLDDLLATWQAPAFASAEAALGIIGRRCDAAGYTLRKLLTRHLVPFRWIAADDQEYRQLLELAEVSVDQLLIAFFSDGSAFIQLDIPSVAAWLGFDLHADYDVYDLLIVGGGNSDGQAALAPAEHARSISILGLDTVYRIVVTRHPDEVRIDSRFGAPWVRDQIPDRLP